MNIDLKYAAPLWPIFNKPKRIKIIVGGRGSMKSTGVAGKVAIGMAQSEVWCCAREFKESIDDSVHGLLISEIESLGIPGFATPTRAGLNHESGGRCFYKGIARNPTGLKSSLTGVHGIWVEEAEVVSDRSLEVLTASVRLSKDDAIRSMNGEHVHQPEIIFTMNRGFKSGAVAKKWILPAEDELARRGYYENDEVMIVQISHVDAPKDWFEASGLEVERVADEKRMSPAQYNAKWGDGWLDDAEDTPLITFEQLKRAKDDEAYGRANYTGGETFIGNDIAARHDLWAAWVLEKVGDVFVTREIRTLHKATFEEHDVVLDDLVNCYKPTRIAIDQTGMGEKPTEDAKRRYGGGVVDGVIFNNKTKHILAQCGKDAFEKTLVRIPDDPVVVADIYKIKQTTTPMGHPRFDAARDESGHADRAWALFLAIYAGTTFTEPAAGVQHDVDMDAYQPSGMTSRRGGTMRSW